MNKLNNWLEGREFYDLMQTYRHGALGSQLEAVQNFEEVKRAIREAAGKRTFVITSVEHSKDRPINYRVQLAHGQNGGDAWSGFTVPIENFGPDLLKPGTKFTLEILDGE